MKYISSKSGYAHRLYVFRLEGDENTLSDAVLVSMADGMSRERALEVEEKRIHPGHFGGEVTRRPGRKSREIYAKIKVYTD